MLSMVFSRYGHLRLPPRLSMRDVWMEFNGTLAGVDDFTIDSGGALSMWSYGNSLDQPHRRYECVNVTVRSDGKLEMLTVKGEAELTLELKLFVVNAGGYVRANRLHLIAENLTIDVAGMLCCSLQFFKIYTDPLFALNFSKCNYQGKKGISSTHRPRETLYP